MVGPTKSALFSFLLAVCLPCLGTAQNSFQANPSSLTFTVPTVGTNVAPQTLSLTTTGASANFSITSSFNTPGCNYLAVSPTTSITPNTITVGVQSDRLPAGTYSCSITVSSGSGGPSALTIPVTINVGAGSGASGNLSVSPTALSLAVPNGFSAATASLTLTNVTATGSAGFSITTNQNWLTVSPTSGNVTSTLAVQVTANASGLSSGVYSGSVILTPSGGSAAIVVPVTLTVSGGPSVQLQQNGSSISAINFVYQTGGGQQPGGQSFTLASSDGSAIACTISQSSSAAYLIISPLGTFSTPQTLSVALTSAATSVQPGNYSININVNCPGAANPSLAVPVNFTVSSTALLSVGTPPVTFNYQTGGATPASQVVQLSTTSTAVPFTTTVSYANGNGWLNVSPFSGTASLAAPASLVVSVDPTSLVNGTYNATVYVYSTNAGNSPVSFPVTFIVGGSSTSTLAAAPSALSFNFQASQTAPPAQSLSITSSGASTSFFATTSSTTCPGFFSITPTSGATPATLSISVNTSGLQVAQVCSGTITVTSTGTAGTLNIPVTLNVTTTAQLQLNPSVLTFTGVLGANASSSQTIAIASSDNFSSVPFTVYSPANWLSVSPLAGLTPATLTVTVNSGASGLRAGVNTTTVTLSSALSTVTLTVVFNLSANGGVIATPASLAFTQPLGGANPAAQPVNLTLTGGLTLANYTVSVISGGTTGWLSVSPISGTVPGTVAVSVNGAGLPAGQYNATLQVTVANANNSPLSIPVTLTVTQPPTLAITPQSLSFTASANGPNPASQTLQITSSSAPINFSATATSSNCSSFLSASPASGTTPATVIVSVNAAGLSPGTCNGTVLITGNGVNSQAIPVTVTVGAALPTISSVGNAASYSTGAVAPGEIVTIFGSNLGPPTLTLGSFVSNIFTTNVGGTQVQFDGVAAPVIYSRNDQVSVVVPFEIAGRLQTNIQVLFNGQASTLLQQRVVDTAPGVFTTLSTGIGQGSIVNQDGTINGQGSPATKGSVVAVYITGAGQTDPNGATGAPGSSNPSQLQLVKAAVSAKIGNAPTSVLFSGAAPTYIQGLYQVNVVVPDPGFSGPASIVLNIGGNDTQSGVTIYIQ